MQLSNSSALIGVALTCSQMATARAAQDFGPRLLDTLSDPTNVAVGDLSGDGRNDVVSLDFYGVAIFASRGRGSFEAPVRVNLPSLGLSFHNHIALADFDADGDLDVIIARSGSTNSALTLIRNDGGNVFTIAPDLIVGSAPSALGAGDMNGDGKSDIVVACESSPQQIKVFLSLGGGAFGPPSSVAMIGGVVAGDLEVADINGNGQLDVVTANSSSPPTFTTLFGNGNGTLGAPTNKATATSSSSDYCTAVTLGAWHAGSALDLAVSTSQGFVRLFSNPGNGVYVAAGSLLSTSSSGYADLASGDIDGDGFRDLLASRANGQLRVWRGVGNGAFSPLTTLDTDARDGLASGDVDGDAIDDVVLARDDSEQIEILVGSSPTAFANLIPYAQPNGSNDVALGDLDHDGRTDVVSIATSGVANVRLGQVGGGFAAATTVLVNAAVSYAKLGLIDGDANLDLLVTSQGGALVLFGDGAGGFGAPQLLGNLPGGTLSELGDLTGDGIADFAYCYTHTYFTPPNNYVTYNDRGIAVGDGVGGFTIATNSAVLAYGSVIGDWNEDGLTDIAFWDSDSVDLVMSYGGGVFSPGPSFAVPGGANWPHAIDLNHDGHLDLINAGGFPNLFGAPGTIVLLGDGTGNFAVQPSIGPPNSKEAIAADFDGDGNMDLVSTSNPDQGSLDCNVVNLFRGDGAGNFAAAGSFATQAHQYGRVATIEATGDALLDLLTSGLSDTGFTIIPSRGGSAPPIAYCTAKVTSNGCVPAVAWSGTSSATATSGFTISCSNAINNKNGLLFYSLNGRAELPFQAGTMCVRAPQQRTPLRSSNGNPPPDDCSGVFALDFNAFAHGLAGGSPSNSLTTPGAAITAQWWGRDPASNPGPTQLSNALDFLIGP